MNPYAVLMCGHSTMAWSDLCKAISCQRRKIENRSSQPRSETLHQAFSICRQSKSPIAYRSILDVLNDSRFSKCLDPRGRIYALRNMLHQDERRRIQPDYSASPEDVYQNLLLTFAVKDSNNHTSNLELLRRCILPRLRHDMPTWVPDLTSSFWPTPLDSNFSSIFTDSDVQYIEPKILRVTGLHFDIIETVRVSHLTTRSEPECRKLLLQLALDDTLSTTYPTGCSLLEALCRTLRGDPFSNNFLPSEPNMASYRASEASLKSLLKRRLTDFVRPSEGFMRNLNMYKVEQLFTFMIDLSSLFVIVTVVSNRVTSSLGIIYLYFSALRRLWLFVWLKMDSNALLENAMSMV